MSLEAIGIILAVIFFISTVILSLRALKKKKPVYFYKSNKIIGVGTEAPKEIKLYFEDKPVSDVYRTTIKFWNRGSDVIHKDSVTDKVAIHFKGGTILREPEIIEFSSESIKFNVEKIIRDGDEAVEFDFLYLDHGDGVTCEVIHTASNAITNSGNIIGAKIRNIDEFKRPYFMFRVRSPMLMAYIMSLAAVFMGYSIGLVTQNITADVATHPVTLAILIVSSVWVIGIISLGVIPYMMYKPPKWSNIKK